VCRVLLCCVFCDLDVVFVYASGRWICVVVCGGGG